MTGNNPNLDLININAHTKSGHILYLLPRYMSGKEILRSVKGHNSYNCMKKMMCNNPNQDLVNANTYTIFGLILSICSQDIEQKRNYYRMTDERKDGQPKSSITPLFQSRAIIKHLCQSL